MQPLYSAKDRQAIKLVDAAVAAVSRVRREAARSLEEVTLEQSDNYIRPGRCEGNDVWNLTRTQYGCGVIELRASRGSWLKKPPAKSFSDVLSSKSSPAVQQPLTGERFESSVKRSRRTLRERCLQLNADNLLTLTKRGKFKSVDELWRTFKEFSRLMKLRFGTRFQYVAVPELHADGETFHMHLALRGFFMVEAVRPLWYRALGGTGREKAEHTPGNVDFSKSKRRYSAGPAKARKLAGYISKYVGKGFTTCSRNRRLFVSSSGLTPDHVTRWHCRDWNSTREFCIAAQQWLHKLGGNAQGDAFFWSRHRGDESLLMTGFILSTVGVIKNA